MSELLATSAMLLADAERGARPASAPSTRSTYATLQDYVTTVSPTRGAAAVAHLPPSRHRDRLPMTTELIGE